MPTDPLTGSRYPAASAAPNVAQDIQNAVMDLADNTTPRFATTGARDTAYTAYVAAGGTLSNGMSCWCDSPGAYFDRIGGAWIQRADGNRILAFTEYSNAGSENLNSASTVLTVYNLPTITVPANRRLRLVHTVHVDSFNNVATYVFRYRLNGTNIRESWVSTTGAQIPETRTWMHEIKPGAGSFTFSISGQQMAGVGTMRLMAGPDKGPTQFYVEDIGGL